MPNEVKIKGFFILLLIFNNLNIVIILNAPNAPSAAGEVFFEGEEIFFKISSPSNSLVFCQNCQRPKSN